MQYDALFYVQPFIYAIGIAIALCFMIIVVSKKMMFHDVRNDARHIHTQRVSRFGGIAVILAFMGALIFNPHLIFDRTVWAMFIGGGAILLFGVIDDVKPLSWQSQLFFQVVIVLITFIFGIQIAYIINPFGGSVWLISDKMPVIGLLFMMAWMIFIMNAVNWCDGIDGLAGGVIFIAAMTLFILSLEPQVMQPPIAIIAIALAGSVLGFLLFNFPSARIFAGSSGAFFMGYIVALLAIAAGAKIGTTLLVLAVPLVDAAWVIGNRVHTGRSIFHGDKEHLHHRLLDRGWSIKKILFSYYGITIMCSCAAVLTQSLNKLFMFVGFCTIIIVFFVMVSYERTKTSFV